MRCQLDAGEGVALNRLILCTHMYTRTCVHTHGKGNFLIEKHYNYEEMESFEKRGIHCFFK